VNKVTTVGVDLAKEVIVVCGADAAGHVVFRKQLSFAGFAAWAANLPPCVVGMEACSSAHHWARYLVQHGHDARLMAAEFVAPFRMSRGAKNDRNDAEAIMVAMRQPTMRFVAAKSVDQQAMLSWHRARSGFMQERKSLLNRTRGLLSEFGIWIGRSSSVLQRKLPELMDEPSLPDLFKPILRHALEHLRQLDERIDECDARLVRLGAQAEQLRWQDQTRRHHQARRQLPARTADAGRSINAASGAQARATEAITT
jgi:transposase